MASLRAHLSLLAVFGVLLHIPAPVLAQRPLWTPIAELLVGSLGESDPARMSAVMSRCTALNMLFAGLAADVSPEMAQGYEQEAHRMIENGVLIESTMERDRTGQAADIEALSGVIVERVKGMLDGYNQWLDANQSADGFSINKDIELEMDSCKLAGKLMSQLM